MIVVPVTLLLAYSLTSITHRPAGRFLSADGASPREPLEKSRCYPGTLLDGNCAREWGGPLRAEALAAIGLVQRAMKLCQALACDSSDCNNNSRPDACDIQFGVSLDQNINLVPDECEADCDVTSIDDKENEVKIYPNPSSNIFNLEFNSDYETEILVTNILGEQVYFESIKSIGDISTKIDLSDYSKGVYNLTIKTSDGISNHKLILQ